MKTKLFYFLLAGIIISGIFSCKKDTYVAPVVKISEDTIALNKWIYDNMQAYYLWTKYMPTDIDYNKENDPKSYFKKLLYTEKDKWSWITDDYASLEAEFSGVQVTMGYSPKFYLMPDGKSIFMAVEYVYPGSAAEQAGLKRGNLVLSINNTKLDTINYYKLYSGTSYSVQLGVVSNGTIVNSGVSMNLTAQSTTTDPAIFHKVIEKNGTKVGYLVYVGFVSGDNQVFLTSLDNIFAEFKSAGISKLIVDLRYNPGGEISAAQFLASEIAPLSVISSESTLINMKYNDGLQGYIETYSSIYANYLSCKFIKDVTNVNMQSVYFLTTSGTASASELVISGLKPYMDVIQIGESTYGKYTGAWVMPDDKEEWAMVPIVLQYANANGLTEFTNGLSPNYLISDDLINAVPFGDISDPMLAKALSLATGSPVKSAIATYQQQHRQIVPESFLLKRNLFVPFNLPNK